MNPFAAYGLGVTGPRFVGREDELRLIGARLGEAVGSEARGCLEIVGPPKIGKSSLARQSLLMKAGEFATRRVAVVEVNVDAMASLTDLLQTIVARIGRILKEHGASVTPISNAIDQVRSSADWSSLREGIYDFAGAIRASDWGAIIILDEFDGAVRVFGDDARGFQLLREIAQRLPFAYVTTSRRRIVDIERLSSASISNFHNIFDTINLTMFGAGELAQLALRLRPDRVEAGLDAWLATCTGGQPYLAEALLFHLTESLASDAGQRRADALRKTRQVFETHYRDLNRTLTLREQYQGLHEILFGPAITVTRAVAEELVRFGVLTSVGERGYECFLDDYQDFLRNEQPSLNLWPQWRATERALRRFVEKMLLQEYGKDYWTALVQKKPQFAETVARLTEMRERTQRQHPRRVSLGPLEFSYPQQLWELMAAHWKLLAPSLGDDKAYWDLRFRLLAKVRNDEAHNRSFIEDYEKEIFSGYCKEIIERLGKPS
jgi:hypothetical protein